MIDVHSQASKYLDLDDIVPLMDRAGVARTLLSARRGLAVKKIAAFARAHPERITASVRIKGGPFRNNAPKFYTRLAKQLADPVFKAMAEIMIYHAEKRKGDAAEVNLDFDEPQVLATVSAAREHGWPIILHIEFGSYVGDHAAFMANFERFLRTQGNFPVAVTHLGQLEADSVNRLIEKHPNIHFITSHANTIVVRQSNKPWVDMFDGGKLAEAWKTLVTKHPDRFILAFDNVWREHWGQFYIDQAILWQRALQDLPSPVAHMIAHKNAERLWKLPPARMIFRIAR